MNMNRIILADDHSFVRLGIIQILKDEFPNADIVQVGDAESLIKEVSLHNWDLVITDLDMPGRSGLEALEQIKVLKPDLPVLVLSIYPEDLYAVRVLRAGAAGYLNKNSAPEELIVAIQRISMGKKYITPKVAEMLAALERVAGPQVRARVRFERDERIAGIVARWPTGARADRAAALGLTPEASFDDIVRQYIADQAAAA